MLLTKGGHIKDNKNKNQVELQNKQILMIKLFMRFFSYIFAHFFYIF